jgi:adenosylcobinamide amidohydrolase
VLGQDNSRDLAMIVWRLAEPTLAVSSAPLGGGIGLRAWVVNAQVPGDYSRRDPDRHLEELAAEAGLSASGVGMLTAASVSEVQKGEDSGVLVHATVGVDHPTWAAADDAGTAPGLPGTVNIVAFVPARLSDAALVNAVVTLTEAKTQALIDAGVAGTGTASDAVCVLCRPEGAAEPFCGPRSPWGARLARATYRAVSAGCGNDAGTSTGADEPAGPDKGFFRRPGTTAI